jgi:rare lipoprotein A
MASYYHDSFHGNRTASGALYRKGVLSAAHKTLPLGTKVRVTRLSNGKSIIVRINDRGPHVKGRIIDLSRRAARDLGIIKSGVAKVEVEVLGIPDSALP